MSFEVIALLLIQSKFSGATKMSGLIDPCAVEMACCGRLAIREMPFDSQKTA